MINLELLAKTAKLENPAKCLFQEYRMIRISLIRPMLLYRVDSLRNQYGALFIWPEPV